MILTVVRISQEFDLEQNVTVNFVHLRLSGGKIIHAMVDDNDIQAIVQEQLRQKSRPEPAITPPTPEPAPPSSYEEPEEAEPSMSDDGLVTVFGGDGADMPDEEPPPAPARQLPALRRRMPTTPRVQADEAGNPITSSGVDPTRFIDDSETDGMIAG